MNDETPEGFASVPRWLQRDESVSGRAKLVYLALSSRADRYGSCWPSHRSLAAESSLSVRTVKRALIELRDLGVIEWEARTRPDNPGRTSNRYRLITPVENPGDN